MKQNLEPNIISTKALASAWAQQLDAMFALIRQRFPRDPGLTNWHTVPGNSITFSNRECMLDVVTSSNRFYRVRVLP